MYRILKYFVCLPAIVLIMVGLVSCSDSDDGFDPNIPGPATREDSVYKSFLGPWILTGRSLADPSIKLQYNVSVTEKVKGKSYNLYGWGSSKCGLAYPIEVDLRPDGSIMIDGNRILGRLHEENSNIDYDIRLICYPGQKKYFDPNERVRLTGRPINGRIELNTNASGGLTYSKSINRFYSINEKEENIITAPCLIKVEPTCPQYKDGEMFTLQESDYEKGMNITILGDGYTAEYDFDENGRFFTDAKEAMEHFFSIEPYKYFRKNFNVRAIATYSKERGCSNLKTDLRIDNAFSSSFKDIMTNTTIVCNHDKLHNYYRRYKFDKNNENDIIILLMNSDFYGGTAFMSFSNAMPNIAAVPVCRRNKAFGDILKHEAGGHAFGLLADEYVYKQDQNIPSQEQEHYEKIRNTYHFGTNITFQNGTDPLWNRFRLHSHDYPFIGYFEGALTFGKGVWRSELNSCMRDMYGRFSTVSREFIFNKIKAARGETCSIEDFIRYDKRNLPEYESSRDFETDADKGYEPLNGCVFFIE